MTDPLERVLDRLDRIGESLVDVRADLANRGARLDAVEKQIERVLEILVHNDGHAIVPRVALLEESLSRAADAIERLALDVEELDQTKLSGDLPSSGAGLAAVDLAREETTRRRWDAIKPVLVAAPGAVALLIQALKWIVKEFQ